MTTLREAAQQALDEMANARDHIYLLPENAQPLSETEILSRLKVAITTLRAALAEPVQAQLTAEHISSPECWCQPELNYVDPVTGAKVWVHKEIQ